MDSLERFYASKAYSEVCNLMSREEMKRHEVIRSDNSLEITSEGVSPTSLNNFRLIRSYEDVISRIEKDYGL